MSPETRIAVLGERMKTVHAEARAMQAEYTTDRARPAEDSAKRDATWDVEAAKRETRLLLAIAAMLAVGFRA